MPPWRRNLFVVAFSNFVTMAGMSAFMPFLPEILREGGGFSDPERLRIWSGLVVAVAPLAAVFTGPLWGALGDRYGAKLMVLRSLAGIFVMVGLMGLATTPAFRAWMGGWWLTPWPLLVLRFCQGTFSGFIAPALTLVTVTAPQDRQGLATSVTQSSLVSGSILGPVLGAWAGSWGGAHVAFYACSALALVAFLAVVFFAVEADLGVASASLPPLDSLRRAWRDVRGNLAQGGLKAVLLGLFLSQLAVHMVNPVLLLHVEGLEGVEEYGAWKATAHAFSAVAVAQLLFAPLWGRRVDRVGTRGLIPWSTMLTALAVLPQAWVREVHAFWAFRFLQGAAAAGTVPTAYVHIGKVTAAHHRGGIYALTLSSLQLSNVVAPLLGGLLSAAFGMPCLFVVASALLAVSSVWTRRRL